MGGVERGKGDIGPSTNDARPRLGRGGPASAAPARTLLSLWVLPESVSTGYGKIRARRVPAAFLVRALLTAL